MILWVILPLNDTKIKPLFTTSKYAQLVIIRLCFLLCMDVIHFGTEMDVVLLGIKNRSYCMQVTMHDLNGYSTFWSELICECPFQICVGNSAF